MNHVRRLLQRTDRVSKAARLHQACRSRQDRWTSPCEFRDARQRAIYTMSGINRCIVSSAGRPRRLARGAMHYRQQRRSYHIMPSGAVRHIGKGLAGPAW